MTKKVCLNKLKGGEFMETKIRRIEVLGKIVADHERQRERFHKDLLELMQEREVATHPFHEMKRRHVQWFSKYAFKIPGEWRHDRAIVRDFRIAGECNLSLPGNWVDAGISHPNLKVIKSVIKNHTLDFEQIVFWLYRKDLPARYSLDERKMLLYQSPRIDLVGLNLAHDVLNRLTTNHHAFGSGWSEYDYKCLQERFVPQFLPTRELT
jgi:hypothetical protein